MCCNFKQVLRRCKAIKTQETADNIVKKVPRKDSKQFWKEIRKLSSSSCPLPTVVGKVHEDHEIASLWQEHISSLLNSNSNPAIKDTILEKLDHDCHLPNRISPIELCNSTNKLKSGKSAGPDTLQPEHSMFCFLFVLMPC